MPRYVWKGIKSSGEVCRGAEHAQSPEHVQDLLIAQGIAVLSCRQAFDVGGLFVRKSVDFRALALFYEQLGVLVDAGVPLVQALNITIQGVESRYFRDVLELVVDQIHKGSSLASAMAKHAGVFKEYTISLVHAGEQTGSLGGVFGFLAAHFKSWGELEKRLKQSATVPLLTLGFAVVIIFGVLTFVIPKFATFLTSFSATLPMSTRCVLWLSDALTLGNLFIMTVGAAGLWFVSIFLSRKPRVAAAKERLILMIPIIRESVVCAHIVQFLTMMILFLRAGYSLKGALLSIKSSTKSTIFAQELDKIVRSLEEGQSLYQAMTGVKSKFFPERLAVMVGIGEQGGDLVGMLERALIMYKQDLDRLFGLIEAIFYPLLMIIVGGFIAFLMISVYLPIFSLGNAFNFSSCA